MNDGRIRKRRALGVEDNIHITFKWNDFEYFGFVFDLTAEGMGVEIPYPADINFSIGDLVTCEVLPSGLETISLKATVAHISDNTLGSLKIGFKYLDHQINSTNKKMHFSIPEHLRPPVSFAHPVFFNDNIWMKISEFSRNELVCTLSSRNDHLIPGMKLKLIISLPVLGNIFVDAEVKLLKPNKEKREELIGTFKLGELSDEASGKISEFIVMINKDISFECLRNEGFVTVFTSSVVDFSIVRDEEDLNEVCKLRLSALQSQGHFLEETDPSKLLDRYDNFSRICAVKVGKKIIGTARLVYNHGNRNHSEHTSEYGVEIPEWIWKAGFVEASRVATDPQYRAGDLFINITQWLGRQTMLSGYKYMLSSCTKALAPVYIKSGCKKIGSYTTDDGVEWVLLVLDVPAVSKAKNIDPFTWNIVYRPTVEYVSRRGKLSTNPIDRMFISTYTLFGPLAKKLFRKSLLRKSKGSKKHKAKKQSTKKAAVGSSNQKVS